MSLHSYVLVFGILALSPNACGGHRSSGCVEAARLGVHELRGGCGGPAKEDKGEKESEDGKSGKLKLGKDGSPTNKDMDKIDKAIRKKNPARIYNWPLWLRLCTVALILSTPLLIIMMFIRVTPREELSTNIYVKTALHCGFSFTVGWLNCIMLLRYRVFATMMVGNTILMGVAFVCNGGMSQAKEEVEGYWWMGQRAQVLCPAQFEGASHYAIMIFLFLFGSFCQGFLFKKFGWTSRPFAPIVASGIIAVEMLEYFKVIQDSRLDVYLLSPIFGMFVSISAHCGVGSVPWAATGHMVSTGYKLGSWCSDFNRADFTSVVQNTCLWSSFVLGIMMGTLFHKNRTVMLCALSLQGLLILNGVIFRNDPRLGKSASEETIQDGESTASAKSLPAAEEDLTLGVMFVPGQQSAINSSCDKPS